MNLSNFLQQQVAVFQNFTAGSLKQLVDGSRVVSLEAQEVIAHQGAAATHFGVVVSGTVSASVGGAGSPRQLLGELKAGDTFGEMALLTGTRWRRTFWPSHAARCCSFRCRCFNP